jgi:uncharacterized phage protein (TIGR01671 family)
MREILFRGKRVDSGEWIKGHYIKATHHWHKHGIHEDWIVTGASQNGGWFNIHNRHAVVSETIGQYTGLTDKNGKKIFEGDIFSEEDDEIIGVVVFENGAFKIKWYGITTVLYEYGYDDGDWDEIETESFDMFYVDKMEVIGNIHDNPELLKGGEG